MSENVGAARAPEKPRGKTRNAFGGKHLLGNFFDFQAFFSLDKKEGLDVRMEMKRMCFDGLYKLSEVKSRVSNHLNRLDKYRAVLMATESISAQEALKKFVRFLELLKLYEKIFSTISAIETLIGFLLDDIDARDFRKKFASRLRIARTRTGLTQEELAQRIGIKRSTYGQFEQGRNEPNVSVLPKLSRELNCSAEWLLGITP